MREREREKGGKVDWIVPEVWIVYRDGRDWCSGVLLVVNAGCVVSADPCLRIYFK